MADDVTLTEQENFKVISADGKETLGSIKVPVDTVTKEDGDKVLVIRGKEALKALIYEGIVSPSHAELEDTQFVYYESTYDIQMFVKKVKEVKDANGLVTVDPWAKIKPAFPSYRLRWVNSSSEAKPEAKQAYTYATYARYDMETALLRPMQVHTVRTSATTGNAEIKRRKKYK